MATARTWVSLGALGAGLLLYGCKQEQQGTGGAGPAEQVEEAQRQSKEAFEQAKSSQEEAIDAQEEARSAEAKVDEARQELQEAEQRAQQLGQKAQQAQQQASQQAKDAQQTAQQSQQQAQRALEQSQQQAEQERQQYEQQQQAKRQQLEAEQQQTEQQAQQAQSELAQPPDTQPVEEQLGIGGAGTAGQTSGHVSGQLTNADAQSVTIQSPQQGSMTLDVTDTTRVLVDGKPGSLNQLERGAQVKASYSMQNQRPTATNIEASKAQQ